MLFALNGNKKSILKETVGFLLNLPSLMPSLMGGVQKETVGFLYLK
jgi:hypothetical protein